MNYAYTVWELNYFCCCWNGFAMQHADSLEDEIWEGSAAD